MGIIEELVSAARERARALKTPEPPAKPLSIAMSLADALRGKDRLAVIAEFKHASPSEGVISARSLEEQVATYQNAGAAAVSVLTEPTRFRGSYEDLARTVEALSIPALMKDFVVEPIQVWHAAALGARGVLLIVRCLSGAELRELVATAKSCGLTPLVECHDEDELELALELDEDDVVIGVNNRNLDTLTVDTSVAPRLLARVGPERISVAESGYRSAEDVRAVRGLADAVLVGTALMKHEAPETLIEAIRG